MRQHAKTPSAEAKVRIQALLRQASIERDGGCILRDYPVSGACGGYAPKSGELILQAEHLVSRERSVCFADLRNIVCLCAHHHGHWKQRNSSLYWEIIRDHIGPALWTLHKRWRDDQKSYPMSAWDWQKAELALRTDLDALGGVEY